MKLSEAIRLGAMLRPQGYKWLLWNDSTCALGAALDACGDLAGMDECVDYNLLIRRWPWLDTTRVVVPATGEAEKSALVAIWKLNDLRRWTREQIADWVETIEQQQETPEPVAVEVVG